MQTGPWATYSSVAAVAPSDSASVTCRAIYVGGAGNVTVTMTPGGAPVTFTAPPVGSVLPVQIEQGRVNLTGTTATLLLLLA